MLFTEEDKTFIIIFDLIMGYGLRKLMILTKNKKIWIG